MPSASDALEDLEPIRRSIRSVCLRDQRTWELSWKAVLGDSSHNSRRGVVLPDVVQQTLELNGVRLTSKALASALAPFRTPSGAVNLRQWLRWIDLSRPEDHVDPELHAARLPQPFRRVHKVLETDILDAAWQRIVRCSARYKAELSAGATLSARSARSSVLTLLPAPGTELDVLELQNDYEAAKKRCCKRALLEIALHEEEEDADQQSTTTSSELRAVLLSSTSSQSQPSVVVLVRERQHRESLRCSIELQLQSLSSPVKSGRSATSTTVIPVLSVDATSSASESPSPSLRVDLVTGVVRELSTPLQQRVLRVALLVSVVSETSTQSLVRVIDVSLSPSDAAASSTIAALDSAGDAVVSCLDLAHDGASLAIAIASTANEIRVFALPLVAAESPLDLLATTPSAVWTTTPTPSECPASSVFFLRSPALTVDADADFNASPPSCVAVVAGDTLSKWRLLDAASPSLRCGVWRHLAPIACASLDVSTQFLSLGLRDGTLVVWDLVAERDHVVLPAPFAPAPVARVVLYRQRYLVALSSSSAREQELCFFDLVDRSAPLLIRSVRPPPPPSSSSEQELSERVTFTSLSPETSSVLDVPVVFVGYSNGFVMLMDVRNGEAMGSVRSMGVGRWAQRCWPTRDAVVVAASSASLRVFDWTALLETAFPALPHLATQHKLPVDSATLKRLFLASVDDSQSLHSSLHGSAMSPLTLSSLAFGARPTLLSMLHATAGNGNSVPKASPSTLASPSNAGATHGNTQTNSLSSLTTAASAVPALPLLSSAAATERHDAALPPLPTVATRPHCPTPAALLQQFLASRQSTGDRDQRVHRRRNELLKALTAAW